MAECAQSLIGPQEIDLVLPFESVRRSLEWDLNSLSRNLVESMQPDHAWVKTMVESMVESMQPDLSSLFRELVEAMRCNRDEPGRYFTDYDLKKI